MSCRLYPNELTCELKVNGEAVDYEAQDAYTSEKEEYERLSSEADRLQDKAESLRTAYLDEQAGILADGLEDGKPRTLEEVGQMFGVTRERIRQIEAKALRKLRHPSRSRKLRDYMEE